MSSKKRGLGKGLNELLSATLNPAFICAQEDNTQQESLYITSELQTETPTLRYVPIEKMTVGPFQPRQQIQHEGLEHLAESIRAQGILQPMVVRLKEDRYEIIAGERRWRAAQLAGLDRVPVIIRHVTDEAAMAMALIENIQREDLSPMEEAQALKRLADDLKLTHLQVAEAVGKSRTSITNLLRLLTLNLDVQILLEQNEIEMGHARALLGLKGSVQSQLAQTVVARGLSVRETERMVHKVQEEVTSSQESKEITIDPNIRRLEEDLADKLGAKVTIRHAHKGQGMVVIRYNNVDELEGILAHIR